MYELIQVTDNCCYIQSPAKIGVIKTGPDQACLIDSGNDKSAGRKAKKILDEQGWELKAIYNTHSHADHIGGNRYLQNQTGCKVYAHGIERALTEYPILEPSCLYGANPPQDLRHKFLMAQSCEVLPMTEDCLPEGLAMIRLPGHAGDMVGFRTEDDIVFLADCLSSEAALEKYPITFLWDVAAYLETLERVCDMQARLFIPSHADPAEDIRGLAEYNIRKVREVGDAILDLCREPAVFESVLQKLFEHYGLTMTFEQHALVGSTVRSYLTWLKDQERLAAEFNDNMLLWRAV